MFDFQLAYKAHIPFVSIRTDDIINVRSVLQHWSQKAVQSLPTAKNATIGDSYLWWTEDPAARHDRDVSKALCGNSDSRVVINPDKPSLLVYDTGILQTPTVFYRAVPEGVRGGGANRCHRPAIEGLVPQDRSGSGPTDHGAGAINCTA